MFKKTIVFAAVSALLSFGQVANAQHGNSQMRFARQARSRVASDILNLTIKRALQNSPVNVNLIRGRGNGVGQTIVAPTAANKRININLVSDSVNGSGNQLLLGGVRGGFGINVVDGSANGAGNDVHLRGRGGLRNGININVIKRSANGRGNEIRSFRSRR